ncbi:MAG: S41 family peptidase [Victivallales bacterium]|nr:S41 family peptidase [Victivallales bacterium]
MALLTSRKIIILLLPLVPVFAAASAETAVPAVAESRPVREPCLAKKLLPELEQILELIQTHSRLHKLEMTRDEKYSFLRKLVKALNPFMDLLATLPPALPRRTLSYPAVKLRQGKVLYFRFDAFTDKNTSFFFKDAQEMSAAGKLPEGVILDLRDCSGFEYANMRKLFSYCSNSEVYFQRLPEIKALPLKVICLISGKTRGAAETLAQALIASRGSLVLGQTSGGDPFARKALPLKSGFFLTVPEIPAFINKLPAKPVIAPTAIPDSGQQDFSALHQTGNCGNDACLQTALDLLTVSGHLK